MKTYIGILDGAGDVWGVRIPDVPGCFGGGDTPEEAISSANEALAILMADEEYAQALPSGPTPIEILRQDAEIREALANGDILVLLRAERPPEGSTTMAAE